MIFVNLKCKFPLLVVFLAIICRNFSDGKIANNDPMYRQATGKTYNQLLASGEYYSTEEMFGENWSTSDPEWRDYKQHERPLAARGPSKDAVKFLFYTPSNPTKVKLTQHAGTIRNAGWNSTKEVKVLIHGYRSDWNHAMPQGIKNAYINAKVEVNILIVDWGDLAGGLYWNAAWNTEFVAGVVVDFLEFLEQQRLITNLDKVHLIGFSLGAHLAGDIGAAFKKRGKTIERITGLDPAGPGYLDSSVRLDPSDAKFVDVIHTNTITFSMPIGLGTSLVSGHADFYPNGGSVQPGCKSSIPLIGSLLPSCHHGKAVGYYIDSISEKNKYRSCPCGSWDNFIGNKCSCSAWRVMGEYCDKIGTRGTFYLRT